MSFRSQSSQNRYRNPFFNKRDNNNKRQPVFIDENKKKIEENRRRNEESNKKIAEQLKEAAAPITSFVNRVKSVRALPVEQQYMDGWCYVTRNKDYKTEFYTHKPLNEYTNYDNRDINSIMYDIINHMSKNWQNYRDHYDETYGEGAYEEEYCFPNKIRFDDSDDEEDDNNEDSEEEY